MFQDHSLLIPFTVMIFFIFNIEFSNQECGFSKIQHKPFYKFEDNSPDDNLRFLQNQNYKPIRIYFDYTTLDSQASVSSNLKTAIQQILANAQSVLQNIVNVNPLQIKIKITQCDNNVTISNQISTVGVDADLVIFPFVDTTVTGNTEAYATACVISGTTNRPVAGIIGFTLKTDPTKPNWLQYYTTLALHEFSHVLAFNPSMYNLFVDSNNNVISQDKVLATTTLNGESRTLIITPKVVAAAQRHFNCPSIQGVELENQGGTGTASSHWEARIMLTDYMIGFSYDEATISEISLAFLEDTGWYKVNYYTGGLFRFGKNEGCGFLSNKCVTSAGPSALNEYCTNTYAPFCSSGRLNKGICYINTYTQNLDPPYQYFSSPNLGGIPLADYCPVSAVPTNDTYFFPWSCSVGNNQYPDILEEQISSESACFMSNLINNNYLNQISPSYVPLYRSMCYKYGCNFGNNTITVTIGQTSVNCPEQGGEISVPGYTGQLFCPDFNLVCTSTTPCANMIDCAKNSVPFLTSSFGNNYVRGQITNGNQTSANASTTSSPNTGSTTGQTSTTTGQTSTTAGQTPTTTGLTPVTNTNFTYNPTQYSPPPNKTLTTNSRFLKATNIIYLALFITCTILFH